MGTSCSASQRIRVTPAWVSAHAPSREQVEESGAAGVGHLELLAEQLDRVAGERGPAAGLDPGDERQRPCAVGEQRGAVAEQGGGAASADLSEAVGEDPADRPERVLVGAHRAARVDHQPDVRLLDRRRDLPGDPPRMGADGPSGLPLRLAAGVGAAVEPPAGRALVDPPGAVRQRLAQPGGVAAGVLDLVGRGGSVDAAVGHPAGRHPGPSPPSAGCASLVAELPRLRGPAAGRGRRRAARAVPRALVRAPARALRPTSPRRVRRRSRLWSDRHSSRRRWSSDAGGSGGPMIARYSRAARSSASSSPSAIQMSFANSSSSRSRSRSPRTCRHTFRRP